MKGALTLTKKERLSSRRTIEELFAGGKSRSLVAFPIRLVYMRQPAAGEGKADKQMMVSVPKRFLKRAVDRNRVKRQIREAYRLNKQLVNCPEGEQLALAFIWLDGQLYDSQTVEKQVRNLLIRLSEKL